MTKLHELLAIESNLESQAVKVRTDLTDTFGKKRHLFEEKRLTFTPNVEGQQPVVDQAVPVPTMKHAIIRLGEYNIPLIGIPDDAVRERCDKCKRNFISRTLNFMENDSSAQHVEPKLDDKLLAFDWLHKTAVTGNKDAQIILDEIIQLNVIIGTILEAKGK